MNPENSSPIEEVRGLRAKVDRAAGLEDLRAIYHRLDELSLQYASEMGVQLAVGDCKQHLIRRGKELRGAGPHGVAAAAGVSMPPPSPSTDRGNEQTITGPAPIPPSAFWRGPPQVRDAVPPGPHLVQPRDKLAASHIRPWLGVVAGFLAVTMCAAAFLAWQGRNRKRAVALESAVHIETAPKGATIFIDGEARCTSDCRLSLGPGEYGITAQLAAYEPATSRLTVKAARDTVVTLSLAPMPAKLRIVTDMPGGSLSFDEAPPAPLPAGGVSIENIRPGFHTVTVFNEQSRASFNFEWPAGSLPSITGTVLTRNMSTVLVSTLANRARVVTDVGPSSLSINGRTERDAGPAGVDIENLISGHNELTVGQGAGQRRLAVTSAAEPMLTAFLHAGPALGTLIVHTPEDGVRVFVDNREQAARTQGGELRIQAAGMVSVRVSKDGFGTPPEQVAVVKSGATTHITFRMEARN